MSDPNVSPRPTRPRRLPVVIAAVVVAAIVVGGGAVWFLRDDAPESVSLETATAGLATASTAASTTAAAGAYPAGSSAQPGGATATSAASPATSAPAAGIAGSWAVDTSVGTFDFENSTGSFVGFRVKEQLQGVGDVTAVGRTPKVSGTMRIEGTKVTAVEVVADMNALVTNDSRRDSKARGALDTAKFPTARFVLTAPIDLGPDAAAGKPVTVEAPGELTIKGVTRPVRFPLQAKLDKGVVVVVGSLEVVFADYGVQVPRAAIVLSVEDRGPLELQLFFRRS